eukprot:COSAG02_NODE_892_length_16138_cov_14.599875_12_plen_172_part_00
MGHSSWFSSPSTLSLSLRHFQPYLVELLLLLLVGPFCLAQRILGGLNVQGTTVTKGIRPYALCHDHARASMAPRRCARASERPSLRAVPRLRGSPSATRYRFKTVSCSGRNRLNITRLPVPPRLFHLSRLFHHSRPRLLHDSASDLATCTSTLRFALERAAPARCKSCRSL